LPWWRAERSKTPNEIALTVLRGSDFGVSVRRGDAALLATMLEVQSVWQFPVGGTDSDDDWGLLSAIGIAGMDRVAQFNVIATSGRAVEACGDNQHGVG